MDQFIPLLGNWFWWIAAGLLLFAELMAPGIFFLWLAVAAGLVGLVDLVWPMGWHGEVLLFAGLSLVLTLTGWPWMKRMRHPQSDQPHLNQRMNAMVGQVHTLEHPLVNGRGKLRLADTLWDVEGPDLAAGDKVRITATAGMKLVVVAA
jgi:inner membrane protein